MKLFKTNEYIKELKQELETRVWDIVKLKSENRNLELEISIKDGTIDRLYEMIDEKDERLFALHNEVQALKKENEGYFDTITQSANRNIELQKENERLTNGIKAGVIATPVNTCINITYKDNGLTAKNLTRVNGYKPIEEEKFSDFNNFCQRDWQFLVEAIGRDYKNCKYPNDVISHWKAKLNAENYTLDCNTYHFETHKAVRIDIINKKSKIIANHINWYWY